MDGKEYKKGNLTVIWKKDLCIHAANCAKGLPEVFKPKERPWIQTDGADEETIKAQIDKCPSGALSYKMDEGAVASVQEDDFIKVETIPDGPLMVYGSVNISHADKSETRETKVTAFCRCGASANKPFCDGAHRKIEFKG